MHPLSVNLFFSELNRYQFSWLADTYPEAWKLGKEFASFEAIVPICQQIHSNFTREPRLRTLLKSRIQDRLVDREVVTDTAHQMGFSIAQDFTLFQVFGVSWQNT